MVMSNNIGSDYSKRLHVNDSTYWRVSLWPAPCVEPIRGNVLVAESGVGGCLRVCAGGVSNGFEVRDQCLEEIAVIRC